MWIFKQILKLKSRLSPKQQLEADDKFFFFDLHVIRKKSCPFLSNINIVLENKTVH